MSEFYYDFLDKYLDWSDFRLIQMDTNSMYMAILGEFDETVNQNYDPNTTMAGKPSSC